MIRIAVADDEKLARYNLISILRESFANIQIIEAVNGQELLHHIQEKKVDIALVDIRMPRMDGLEAMERCTNREAIPWAIVSSYAEFPYAKRAISLGAGGYILKPPDPAEVREIIMILIKKFEEIKKEKNEKLKSFWDQLLQNLDDPTTSETTSVVSIRSYLDEIEIILPITLSLQGSIFPKITIENIIDKSCESDTEKGLVISHHNKGCGFYEIAWAFSKKIEPLHWKAKLGTHIIARLQHDFPVYQIKIIVGAPCNSLETAANQIIKIRNLLNYEPLLPNTVIGLDEASQLLLPYTSAELEAAHTVVVLIQSWHREDWDTCKNLIMDLYIVLEKIEKGLQYKLIQNLEQTLNISPRISQHLLSSQFLNETKQEILCLIQQKQTAIQNDPLTEILNFISRHFTENLNLSQIANLFGFSPNYLSTLFHQKTGTTYTSYITSLRMKEARNLLRSGVSVKKTAWAVGYADEQHFARLYKKIIGIAPGLEKKSGSFS